MHDAHVLLEAVRLHKLQPVTRRLNEVEVGCIASSAYTYLLLILHYHPVIPSLRGCPSFAPALSSYGKSPTMIPAFVVGPMVSCGRHLECARYDVLSATLILLSLKQRSFGILSSLSSSMRPGQ